MYCQEKGNGILRLFLIQAPGNLNCAKPKTYTPNGINGGAGKWVRNRAFIVNNGSLLM